MDTILKVSGLTVSYPQGFRQEKVALNALDLEVKNGEIFGLLGPNGAGKTTFIKSIVGLITFKKGTVSIFGESSLSLKARARVGYMPEIANYYWFMTPGEILKIFGGFCGMRGAGLKKRIDGTLALVGLANDKNHLVKGFSKGMQSRLNLAQAILHDPDFLILDEPFSGLDPLGRIDFRNIVKEMANRGKTILLSSHELSEAELICNTVCVMRSGKALKYGPMDKLIAEKGGHSLENYFLKVIGGQDA
jgi:ABC-2 type transport system ATP-binding protein